MHYIVRAATSADLGTAAQVLAEAFENYSWTRWALPEDGYTERLEELQLLYLSHALDHGLVFVDDDVRAVAAFLPPDAPAPSADTQLRVGELHGPRLATLLDLSLPEASSESWTLETVGVDPAHQTRGLGTAVTTAGLASLDKLGMPVTLETSSERNLRLYQQLGFAVFATTNITGGPIVHSMRRGALAQ